jgi:hypothetical protein
MGCSRSLLCVDEDTVVLPCANDKADHLALLVVSALEEDREVRCELGIDMGGASLCVRRERP